MWLSLLPRAHAVHASCHHDSHHEQRSLSRRSLLSVISLPLIAAGSAPAAPALALVEQEGNSQQQLADTELLRQQYDQYAETYDDLDGGFAADALGFPTLRAKLLAQASGDVLEVGVGTGLNLQHYVPQQLTSLTAVDLSDGMLAQARARAATLGLPRTLRQLDFVRGDAQALPLPAASYDCVVDTFSLCVFPDPLAALHSMARTLRPGGRLLLLEHARSPLPGVGWYQDLTAPAVAAMGKGCVWNQDVVGLVGAAGGLKVVSVEPHLGGLVVALIAERVGGSSEVNSRGSSRAEGGEIGSGA